MIFYQLDVLLNNEYSYCCKIYWRNYIKNEKFWVHFGKLQLNLLLLRGQMSWCSISLSINVLKVAVEDPLEDGKN